MVDDPATLIYPNCPQPFFHRKLRRGEKRGGGFPFRREHDPDEREVFATLTRIDAGPDYESKLSHSVKDFARGAYEGLPDIEAGKPFFSAFSDFLAAANVRKACGGDPRVYRLMINPLDGGEVINKVWVRRFMGTIQVAIGARLFWFAAIHHHPTMLKSRNRHFHAFIRGRSLEGEKIEFNANFARYGFRTIATRMITDALGRLDEDGIARRKEERAEMAERRMVMLMQRKVEKLKASGVAEWIVRNVTAGGE